MGMMVHFEEDAVTAAIDEVAAQSAISTGRHVEWCRRRIREALEFIQSHDSKHPDYATHMNLAMPVLQAARAIGGVAGEDQIH